MNNNCTLITSYTNHLTIEDQEEEKAGKQTSDNKRFLWFTPGKRPQIRHPNAASPTERRMRV